jgi:hypothetical protein
VRPSAQPKTGETTNEPNDTKTFRRKVHPQISQISADDVNFEVYSICENLRNLWINPLVNKRYVVKDLRVGADGILRAARKFILIELQSQATGSPCRIASLEGKYRS